MHDSSVHTCKMLAIESRQLFVSYFKNTILRHFLTFCSLIPTFCGVIAEYLQDLVRVCDTDSTRS